MKRVCHQVDLLIDYAKKNLGLKPRNEIYARNTILGILGVESYEGTYEGECDFTSPETLLADLKSACIEAGLFEESEAAAKADAVMGALSLSPAEVDEIFSSLAKEDTAKATEWLYRYSVKNDYVKKSVLDKNPRFDVNGLTVTINKAKPEFRDPKKAVSGNSVKGGYPKCSICRDNEGFFGRGKRTLRTVSLKLNGKDWFWQFSPYGYFYQHGIVVNEEHTPMHVDKDTFYALMDFVDLFPHYFVGCNAALPRIGGSVLAHDHFQGGGEVLPLHKAKMKKEVPCKVEGIRLGVLDWPGTVIRIKGSDRDKVALVAEAVRAAWVSYEDREKGIIPEDENGVHSAVSPTVIKTWEGYEMNIILRNNITTEEFPDGVFHAHPEFHSIKKESIGLIEAQGLFILPGRLEEELAKVEACVKNGFLAEECKDFTLVYEECRLRLEQEPEKDIHTIMQEELGSICYRILENTAVFKSAEETENFLKGVAVYG
ncbi:MAG: galactose-1-phosphate uridylyltransferase [Clostridia bacterium]|nr:galactose-1-phosphate uridylyltransferase [Clostridia bacterium]